MVWPAAIVALGSTLRAGALGAPCPLRSFASGPLTTARATVSLSVGLWAPGVAAAPLSATSTPTHGRPSLTA
jgi:hypothetical protein